ncbi:MAG: outer membrane protein transport protein [candidate division Zixibacteria bacterium]|nr:outer membrane protein transport protein [candidate division Zixibacteria bacterium]
MKRSLLKTTVLLLVLATTACGQIAYKEFSFDMCGGGARAEGMGKAFLALSDDVTGGSWNPAGIYAHEKPIIGVSWASLAPRGQTSSDFAGSLLTDPIVQDHSGTQNTVGSLNFLAPIRIKGHAFVGSFNYTRNFDAMQSLDWSWAGYETFYFMNSVGEIEAEDLLIEQDGTYRLDGGLNSLNFALATRVYNNISAGISLNVYTGTAVGQIEQSSRVHDIRYTYDQRGLGEEGITIIDSTKFSGFNATIGLKYSGENFKAGLVVRTPFSLSDKIDSSMYVITKLNGLIIDDGTDTTYIGNKLVKYDLPMMVGLGVAFNLKPNWLISIDGEYRGFSSTDIKIRESILINPGGTNIESFLEVDPEWNNVFAFRIGTEYLWATSVGEVPLRAGFGYVPMPAENVAVDLATETTAQRNFSVGTGIHWEQIRFDIAYTHSMLDQERLEIGQIYTEYENKDNHLNISFTGVF